MIPTSTWLKYHHSQKSETSAENAQVVMLKNDASLIYLDVSLFTLITYIDCCSSLRMLPTWLGSENRLITLAIACGWFFNVRLNGTNGVVDNRQFKTRETILKVTNIQR